MLKLADLVDRADFDAGPLCVSPSRRLVEGPAGSAHVEPIVMKVFLLLLDAGGEVVTRDELFGNAWGGVFVGDDSLNRAIARVRKIATETAPGLFEIETIPRTGYRLTGNIVPDLRDGGPEARTEARPLSRRALVGGGIAAAAVAGTGAGGIWWINRPRPNPRFDALMAKGEDAVRLDQRASNYFEQAVALEPRSAKAWGLLAYSNANGVLRFGAMRDEAAQATERAAGNALALDPNEPNALLALTLVQFGMIDFYSAEQRYLRILAIAPDNGNTMRFLGTMLHSVGRCRDSLTVVERALAIEPFVPDHWARKAGRLWILGRIAEADRIIDRAMQLWPSHSLVRLMRLMIWAFTGRAQAALAIVDEEQVKPIFLSMAGVPVWRASLAALRAPTRSSVAAARVANLEGAQGSPQIAAWAILTLSALGELDAAFEVANGFLLDRGSVIVRPRPDPKLPRISVGWRNTFGLFIPPTKAMRLDPRFKPLADGLGLTDYWRKRGIGPDTFLFKA